MCSRARATYPLQVVTSWALVRSQFGKTKAGFCSCYTCDSCLKQRLLGIHSSRSVLLCIRSARSSGPPSPHCDFCSTPLPPLRPRPPPPPRLRFSYNLQPHVRFQQPAVSPKLVPAASVSPLLFSPFSFSPSSPFEMKKFFFSHPSSLFSFESSFPPPSTIRPPPRSSILEALSLLPPSSPQKSRFPFRSIYPSSHPPTCCFLTLSLFRPPTCLSRFQPFPYVS